ncbi:unnamed protein product [uncultured bacterium]|nr:unnamed protein product [uncultured bacterium]
MRLTFHQCDAAIVGHLACSFLALVLRKELDERLDAAGADLEWSDIGRDLDPVEEMTVDQGTRHFGLRVEAPGCGASSARPSADRPAAATT